MSKLPTPTNPPKEAAQQPATTVPAPTRINPWALPRPGVLTETRTFTDPRLPGLALTVTLQASGGFGFEMDCWERGENLVARYVEGRENADGIREPAEPLIDPKGVPLRLNASLARIIGRLQAMQVAENEPVYQPNEWAAIAEGMPTAFRALNAWADKLLKQTRGSTKNEPGARGETASTLPLITMRPTTPNSSPETTP